MASLAQEVEARRLQPRRGIADQAHQLGIEALGTELPRLDDRHLHLPALQRILLKLDPELVFERIGIARKRHAPLLIAHARYFLLSVITDLTIADGKVNGPFRARV